MSRFTDLMAMNKNQDNREYRFILVSDGGWLPIIYLLEYAPDGWDDEIIFRRDEKYKGVFRKYKDGEIRFPKDGRDYLQNLFELKGITADCYLYVQKFNPSTLAYEDHYSGKLDFATYEIDELFVSIQVLDNGTAERLKNRENMEVNLLDPTTVKGYTLADFISTNTLFNFGPMQIATEAQWKHEGNYYQFPGIPYSEDDVWLKMPLTWSQITQAQDLTSNSTTVQYFIDGIPADSTIKISYDLEMQIRAISNPYSIHAVLKVTGGSGGDATIFDETVGGLPGPDRITIDESGSVDITVSAGDQLAMQLTVTINPDPWTWGCEVDIDLWDIKAEYVAVNLPGVNDITGWNIHEAFLRTCQKILDTTDCFYSEFFKHKISEVVSYGGVDGDNLAILTRGQLIRGLDDGLDNIGLPVSLEKLFDSLSKIYCIGLGIETADHGGNGTATRVRVEALEYFFDDEVILDISDRISEGEIKKKVLPDWHYANIKAGYKEFEYDLDLGIFEYNNKQGYSTPIDALHSKKNTLDLESEIRADSNGVITLRQQYQVYGDGDVSGDDDLFIFDAVRDTVFTGRLQPRTSDGIDNIRGNIDSQYFFNYRLTPKRNLLRWGAVIRAGLEKIKNQYIRFQNNNKIVDLRTQFTGEPDYIWENRDELIDDLDEPRWHPEAYEIEAPLYKADIDAIEAKPIGLIKLSDTKYGWILEIKTGKDNKAKLELLRCNLDYVTPT